METLFGLPAHPLVVHFAVVLTPLVTVLALATAARPAWRRVLSWPLLVASLVIAFVIQASSSSGEEFDELLQGTAPIGRHEDLANTTRMIVILMLLAALVLVVVGRVLDRREGVRSRLSMSAASARHPAITGLSALVAVLSVLSTVWVVRTGHEGAKVTWESVVEQDQGQ
jgi:hypothetical protein